jgi:hypothetical protein
VQTLFDDAPVRFGDREAQTRAAGGEGSFADGAGQIAFEIFAYFFLISVGKPPRTSSDKFNAKARKI